MRSLRHDYAGWDGHEFAAFASHPPVSAATTDVSATPHLRSVGKLVSHSALDRLDWFHQMGVPGSGELVRQFACLYGRKGHHRRPAGTLACGCMRTRLFAWHRHNACLSGWMRSDERPIQPFLHDVLSARLKERGHGPESNPCGPGRTGEPAGNCAEEWPARLVGSVFVCGDSGVFTAFLWTPVPSGATRPGRHLWRLWHPGHAQLWSRYG
jgi:hypothetical protein